MTWLFYTLPLLLLLAAIWIYNRLVFNRQRVAEAWSGIEVQLKRRSSLIPPLVECVRQYQQHEQDTLLQVTRLREQAEALQGAASAARSRRKAAWGRACASSACAWKVIRSCRPTVTT